MFTLAAPCLLGVPWRGGWAGPSLPPCEGVTSPCLHVPVCLCVCVPVFVPVWGLCVCACVCLYRFVCACVCFCVLVCVALLGWGGVSCPPGIGGPLSPLLPALGSSRFCSHPVFQKAHPSIFHVRGNLPELFRWGSLPERREGIKASKAGGSQLPTVPGWLGCFFLLEVQGSGPV